jgi:hypothetical protein
MVLAFVDAHEHPALVLVDTAAGQLDLFAGIGFFFGIVLRHCVSLTMFYVGFAVLT